MSLSYQPLLVLKHKLSKIPIPLAVAARMDEFHLRLPKHRKHQTRALGFLQYMETAPTEHRSLYYSRARQELLKCGCPEGLWNPKVACYFELGI